MKATFLIALCAAAVATPQTDNTMWPFSGGDVVITTDSGVKIENKRNEIPAFGRNYTVQLNSGAAMTITYRTTYRSRYSEGQLTQSNGRWVIFDPDRVADKILDPTLVPIIEQFCAEIAKIDRAYIKSEPNEFVDEAGVKWRRVD